MRQSFVLRKIAGRFDACRAINGWPSTRPAGGFAVSGGFGPVLGAFCAALILPLLVLGAVALLLHGGFGHAHLTLASAGSGMMVGQTEEVKDLMNQLNARFKEFKDRNDELAEQIKTKGSGDAVLAQSVERNNAEITKISAQLAEVQANLRTVETAAARIIPAGSIEAREMEAKHAAAFFGLVRNTVVEHVSDDEITGYRNYKKAFNAYLRRGDAAMNDTAIRNALSTGAATSGGFWVTPDTSGRIVEFVYQTSPLRQIASVQLVGTDTLEGMNDLDEASSGWVGEQSSRPETNTPLPQSKWSIPVHEQYANPKTTQKMLDDSFFDVEGWLAKKVGRKLSREENTAGVTGNGILKLKGFLASVYTSAAVTTKNTASAFTALQYVKSGASGAFAGTAPADAIIDLITALKVEYRQGAMFAGNSTTIAALRKLKDGQGNYLFFPAFTNAPTTGPRESLGTGPAGAYASGSLFGFPVIEMADMPDLAANSFSLAFANWAEAYQIVDHAVGMRTLRDPFTAKPYISYYTTKRVGGDLLNFEAIKLMKFSA